MLRFDRETEMFREVNRKFTFESFCQGSSNRFAYGAAKAVAKAPGTGYNPLLIHSGVGLGKSHLLHSIANHILAHESSKTFSLLSGDDLAKLLENISRGRASSDEILGCDLLLLDDVQFLSGKEALQEELLTMFETLISQDKQIVLTSDRPPEKLSLGSRLLSRIGAGLVVEILPPDFGLKLEVLKSKSKGREVEPEVLEEIAKMGIGSIRDLEGALNRVLAYSAFTDEALSRDTARAVLEKPEMVAPPTQPKAPSGEGEFSQFVAGVGEGISQTVARVQDEERLRKEYEDRIYIWEMKGFDVSRLRGVMDRSVAEIADGFISFTTDVQQLIALQRRFGSIDLRAFPNEARSIEEKLFNPDLVSQVDEDLRRLEEKVRFRRGLTANLTEGDTFDRFIVGESNRDCLSECNRAVALEGPDFLFISGGPGTGKTHLLNAIAHSVTEKNPDKTIFYLLPDTLLREIRTCLAEGESLLQKYGEVDLFLIDGIDSLMTREEEEVTSILKGLSTSGKRVVVTSRTALDGFPEGLREILGSGVVSGVGPPDSGLRAELIKSIAKERSLKLKEEAVQALANRVAGGFWDLEDGFKRVVEFSVEGEEIDEEVVNKAFPPGEKAPAEEVAPKEAPVAVAEPPERAAAPEVAVALEEVVAPEVAVAPEEVVAPEEAVAEEVAPLEETVTPEVAEAPPPGGVELVRDPKEKSILDWSLLKERIVDEY